MNTSIAILGSASPERPVPVPIVVGRVVLAPSPADPSTFNPRPAPLPDPKQMLLVRIRTASVAQLDEIQGRELPDMPGLSRWDLADLDEAIYCRRMELKGASRAATESEVFACGGSPQMFHVEKMGTLAGHFTRLGRALERAEKRPSDWAHIHELAEQVAQLARLGGIEARQDESGCVRQ